MKWLCLLGIYAVISSSLGASEAETTPEVPGQEQEAKIEEASETLPPTPLFIKLPAYPSELHRQGIEGDLIVEVIIDPEGNVMEPRVLTREDDGTIEDVPEEFSAAILKAVEGWRFAPATIDGDPVPIVVRVPIAFRIKKSPVTIAQGF